MTIHIFNGRATPDEILLDWGVEFGAVQIDAFKFTYGCLTVSVNDELIDLPFDGDYIIIGGIFYGDFLVDDVDPTMSQEEFKQKINKTWQT